MRMVGIVQKKICLLGDFSVGKTSLIRRFIHSIFSEDYITTLGVHISKKEVELEADSRMRLLIWDVAGENGFDKVADSYLRGAAGLIIVADVSRAETLRSPSRYFEKFKNINPEGVVLLAVNKWDLLDELPIETIPEDAGALGLAPETPFFKTSAKTGENVEDMFLTMARSLAQS